MFSIRSGYSQKQKSEFSLKSPTEFTWVCIWYWSLWAFRIIDLALFISFIYSLIRFFIPSTMWSQEEALSLIACLDKLVKSYYCLIFPQHHYLQKWALWKMLASPSMFCWMVLFQICWPEMSQIWGYSSRVNSSCLTTRGRYQMPLLLQVLWQMAPEWRAHLWVCLESASSSSMTS